jgi:hypothetical protein
MTCSERACPFPASEGHELCGYHLQVFALEASPSLLTTEATEDDVYSAVWYDQSVSVATRGMLNIEE